jgi:methionyl-tRNA synthetase
MVFLLMTLLEPFMPGVSKQIREQLNVPHPIFSLSLLPFLSPGHQIGKVRLMYYIVFHVRRLLNFTSAYVPSNMHACFL